jgi:hypothetical protein
VTAAHALRASLLLLHSEVDTHIFIPLAPWDVFILTDQPLTTGRKLMKGRSVSEQELRVKFGPVVQSYGAVAALPDVIVTTERSEKQRGITGWTKLNIAFIVLLIGAFGTFFISGQNPFVYNSSSDGYKEAQALDRNHWLVTDDGRGVVYGARFSDGFEEAEIHPLLEGLVAPNGLAVDARNRTVYVADSTTLELHRMRFDATSSIGFVADAVQMWRLKPEMRSPKKALLHPDGTKLLLADQASYELYVVLGLDKWPDVKIITLTNTSAMLVKPHGMTWLVSEDELKFASMLSKSGTAATAPRYRVGDGAGSTMLSTAGILIASREHVIFVRTDPATLRTAEEGEKDGQSTRQMPTMIVDIKEKFRLKHPNGMDVQFVPGAGDGSFLVLSKNSCGVFLVGDTRDQGTEIAGSSSAGGHGLRIIGHDDPGCAKNNPHGMKCVVGDGHRSDSSNNGCIVVQPGKKGGGRLAWLEVPRSSAGSRGYFTKSDYRIWDIHLNFNCSHSAEKNKKFVEAINWPHVEEVK